MTDRRWTVPVGATLALPVLWPSGFATLVALWPILREGRQTAAARGRGRENGTAPTLASGLP